MRRLPYLVRDRKRGGIEVGLGERIAGYTVSGSGCPWLALRLLPGWYGVCVSGDRRAWGLVLGRLLVEGGRSTDPAGGR